MVTKGEQYARGAYIKAAHALATGAGPVRERLNRAWIEIATVKADDISPGELADAHNAIRDSWSEAGRRGTPGDGHIESRLNEMSEDEMIAAAADVMALHYQLQSLD